MSICAFDRGQKCSALIEKQCIGCAFYKTEQEVKESRQKAKNRIKKLPILTQEHISRKYYKRSRSNSD